jgi:hypothetical protein
MAAPLMCGHFLNGVTVIMDKTEQGTEHADMAAKIVASIIIAGILAMFSYGIFHWVILE